MTLRSTSTSPRRHSNCVASVLFALSMLLALVAMQAGPALALARLVGSAGLQATSASASHDRATVSIRGTRSGEILSLKRSPKTADRGRSLRPGDSFSPPVGVGVATSAALRSVPASIDVTASRPVTRLTWQSPARARASLMVFHI